MPGVQPAHLLRRAPLALGALAVAAAAFPAPTGGHPGHGAAQVSIANLRYTPEEITVVTGDTVLWFWEAGDTNHSVTADPGQAESFDSDPGEPPEQVAHRQGDAFAHRFTKVGTFSYACKVHAFMRGRVVVKNTSQVEDPTPPPAPAPDGSTVTVGDLSLRPARMCRGAGGGCASSARLSFTLSDTALVRVRLMRGDRRVRSWTLDRDGGRHALRIRARGLRAGRYRVLVRAETPEGARSPTVTRRLRVR